MLFAGTADLLRRLAQCAGRGTLAEISRRFGAIAGMHSARLQVRSVRAGVVTLIGRGHGIDVLLAAGRVFGGVIERSIE